MDQNITKIVNNFYKNIVENSEDRFASFDFCYNYFQSTEDLTMDMEKSCSMLGFYLASWGMYRGSSFILQRNMKIYIPLIIYFQELKDINYPIWTLNDEVNRYSSSMYNEETISLILEIYKQIEDCIFSNEKHVSKTLVTKIMLGVFGCIPAFDRFFCNTMKEVTNGYKHSSAFTSVSKNSLLAIEEFYQNNYAEIDSLASKIKTISFDKYGKTYLYPKAKVIDMFGFNKAYLLK